MRPICVDLFCGLGGWAEGFLAEAYQCWGFDIERHDYGTGGYPGDLVLQDIHTLHGSQFRDAAIIVASPPCQEYSYMAMPWSRAKQIARALRGHGDFPEGYTGSRTIEELNALFNACFRIQREASASSGRHIPMIVENVRGAQPWVGRSAWNYGSFHLWGDVPALMPLSRVFAKVPGLNWSGSDQPGYKAEAFNTTAEQRLVVAGQKNSKGGSWFGIDGCGKPGPRNDPRDMRRTDEGWTSQDGVKFSQTGDAWFDGKPRDKMLGQLGPAAYGSRSSAPQSRLRSNREDTVAAESAYCADVQTPHGGIRMTPRQILALIATFAVIALVSWCINVMAVTL